jgi:hypothetical protein
VVTNPSIHCVCLCNAHPDRLRPVARALGTCCLRDCPTPNHLCVFSPRPTITVHVHTWVVCVVATPTLATPTRTEYHPLIRGQYEDTSKTSRASIRSGQVIKSALTFHFLHARVCFMSNNADLISTLMTRQTDKSST